MSSNHDDVLLDEEVQRTNKRNAAFALQNLLAAAAEGVRRNVAGAAGLTDKAIFDACMVPGVNADQHAWAANIISGDTSPANKT